MSRRVPIMHATPRQTAVAEADAEYFKQHPGLLAYERAATLAEQTDFGLPPSAICFVVKVSEWQHIRAFRVPNEGVN